MHDTCDRTLFCRCFDTTPPRPAGGRRETADTNHQPAHAGRSPVGPILRPDVYCMQRWLDLNA